MNVQKAEVSFGKLQSSGESSALAHSKFDVQSLQSSNNSAFGAMSGNNSATKQTNFSATNKNPMASLLSGGKI